jgi:CheY-like chemotaxis protein
VVQSYLNEVYRSAQTGARLTHQLRLFSRRQQGRKSHCSLADLLLEQDERLQSNVDHRGKLHLDVPTDLPPVALDTEHLQHVLTVLLDNAVEATPRHSEVKVTACLVDLLASRCGDFFGDLQAGKHVRVCFADNGPGMTPEQWQRVLVEPLFSTKPRHRGLGLAVGYGILHAHRGGLRLRPGPHGGVEAEVLLPVASAALQPTPPTPGRPAENLSGARVLVVDDDLMVLNFVRITLEQAGYRVKAVTNAEEALRSYTAAHIEPFQLVVSDVLMPRVTGLDLARQLLKRNANVRMLFMSGRVNSEFSQNELGNHFDLLSKPFLPEGLLQAVRTAIDSRPSWKAQTAGDDPCMTSTC